MIYLDGVRKYGPCAEDEQAEDKGKSMRSPRGTATKKSKINVVAEGGHNMLNPPFPPTSTLPLRACGTRRVVQLDGGGQVVSNFQVLMFA